MSSTVLCAVILLVCALTLNTAQTSCKGQCGAEYYRGYMCQCDYNCLSYGECCKDFESECTTKNSCKGRCGESFKRGRLCSCDSNCAEYKQCCPDRETYCDAEEEISGVASAAAPVKTNSCHNVNDNKPKEPTLNDATEPSTFSEENNADMDSQIFPNDEFPNNEVEDLEASPVPESTSGYGLSTANLLEEISTEPIQDPDTLEFSTETFTVFSQTQTTVSDNEPTQAYDGPYTLYPTIEVPTERTDARDSTSSSVPGTTLPQPTTAADNVSSKPTPTSVPQTEYPPTELQTAGPKELQPEDGLLLEGPTVAPSDEPEDPTVAPSDEPEDPTVAPSDEPEDPTVAPSDEPEDPTVAPSDEPEDPTVAPSDEPEDPTVAPSDEPEDLNVAPSDEPEDPTVAPSDEPEDPTVAPSDEPEVTTLSESTSNTPPTTLIPPSTDAVQHDSTDEVTPGTTTAHPQNVTPDPTKPAPSEVTSKPQDQPDPYKPSPAKPTLAKPSSKPETKPLDTAQTLNIDNSRDYQADDSNDTNLCSGRPVGAVTTLRNGTMVVFRGHYFWSLDRFMVPGPARGITQVWGVPSPIDTAFTRCNCQGKTYIFKGSKFWRFENDVLDPNYPKAIEAGFGGLRGQITAALSVPQYQRRRESVYFFKRGGLVQKYSYQFGTSPSCGRKVQYPVYTVRNRMVRQAVSVLGPVVNIRTSWRGFPSTITAAVSVPSIRVPEKYKYYVFSRTKSYNVRMDSERPIISAPTANASPQSNDFLKCPARV